MYLEVVVGEAHAGAALAQQPRVVGRQAGGLGVLHAARDVASSPDQSERLQWSRDSISTNHSSPPVQQRLDLRDAVRVEAVHTRADHPGDLLNLQTTNTVKLRRGSGKDRQGMAPKQSLNPSLELTLKLVTTFHHHPPGRLILLN